MGIFDIFTGDPATKAAEQQRQYLDQLKSTGQADTATALGQSTGYVQGGANAAQGALSTGYGTATGAVGSGADAALSDLNAGTTGAMGKLGDAGNAYDSLSALGSKYGAGTDLYLNSLGVNGAAGNQAATAAFQAGPGYDFTMNQGIDALSRKANATGQLVGGNADRDAMTYASGLANQTYGAWQSNLAGLVNPELQATSGAATGNAGVATNEANLLNTSGQNKAQIESGRGSMLADLATQYGTNTAGLDTSTAGSLAGLTTQATQDKNALAMGVAAPYTASYKNEADAQMAGSGNLWNLGLNVAKLATGQAGGSSGKAGDAMKMLGMGG